MNKAFANFEWKNEPSYDTPLSAENLNSMNNALDTVDSRVITLDTTKLDKSTAYTMVQDVSFDESTGIFTITKLNGSKLNIDTKLEKLSINWKFDIEQQRLVITLDDGTEQVVDLSALITQYEFKESDTIILSVDTDGKVYGNLKKGSLTGDYLEPNYLANVKTAADTATASAAAAKASETNAKTSETNAAESATNASSDATIASTSATNAKASETNAKASETNAATAATTATAKASEATSSATAAKTSETNAKASETNANSAAKTAQSYAVGGTGTRDGEDTDNAKYYYETVKNVADYVVTGGVTGVKGSAESEYRTGQVELTPADFGLGNVTNTSDEDKPVSTAQREAIDKIESKSAGKPNTAGWYRVAVIKNIPSEHSTGGTPLCVDLTVGRNYNYYETETHYVRLVTNWKKFQFTTLHSESNTILFTKIRLVYDTNNLCMYLELYYRADAANTCYFTVSNFTGAYQWQAITPVLTEETIDGVTVLSTYDIPANTTPVTSVDLSNGSWDLGAVGKNYYTAYPLNNVGLGAATNTGTLRIKLPSTLGMARFKVSTHSYDWGQSDYYIACNLVIGTSSVAFNLPHVWSIGYGNHKNLQVRFGYDADLSAYVLIGTESTTWRTADIAISEIISRGSGVQNGWEISFTTDNSDITVVNTVTSPFVLDGLATTADLANYLPLSGGTVNALVSSTALTAHGALSGNIATPTPFYTKNRLYYVNKNLGWSAVSYIEHVILLLPVLTASNQGALNYIDGKFLFLKTGANIFDTLEVNANCCWNCLQYYLEYYGENSGWKLCVCTYNGVSYYALKCPYHANPYNVVEFVGHVCSELTGGTNTVALPLDIAYYNQQTSTVLNSEVYNSITDTLTTTYVTQVVQQGKYFPSGINGNLYGNATTATTATTSAKLGRSGDTSIPMTFYWSGQNGQPPWLWGGSDGSNMYVYNPSNFSVNSAAQLTTARTIQTNLGSTGAASFNGTANVTPGVTGVLPIANGGTGANNAASALSNLGITASATELNNTAKRYSHTINLSNTSTYNEDTYYPCVVSGLPYQGYNHIVVAVQLNSGTKPSWSTHSSGFTCNFDVLVKAGGWGTTGSQTIVLDNTYNYANANPVGYTQMTNASRAVLYLRGGGKYYVYTDWACSWTVCTSTYTSSSQSVSPTTTYPGVAFTRSTIIANLDGTATSANTANTLATARTIQTNLGSTSAVSFNGSANVTPGVTGTLGIANGGTGATTVAGALSNLGTAPVVISTSAPSVTTALWAY